MRISLKPFETEFHPLKSSLQPTWIPRVKGKIWRGPSRSRKVDWNRYKRSKLLTWEGSRMNRQQTLNVLSSRREMRKTEDRERYPMYMSSSGKTKNVFLGYEAVSFKISSYQLRLHRFAQLSNTNVMPHNYSRTPRFYSQWRKLGLFRI